MLIFVRRGVWFSILGVLLAIVVLSAVISSGVLSDLKFEKREKVVENETVEVIESESSENESTKPEKTISVVVIDEVNLSEDGEDAEPETIYRTIDLDYKYSSEEMLLARQNTELNIGENLLDVISSKLKDDDFPEFLESSFYDLYMTLSSSFQLEVYTDEDYYDGAEAEGFYLNEGDSILNYTIEFEDGTAWNDLVGEDILIFGRDYRVISASYDAGSLMLLESPYSFVLQKNDFVTIDYNGSQTNISIYFISDGSAMFYRNGKNTGSLEVGRIYDFDDFQLMITGIVNLDKVAIVLSPRMIKLTDEIKSDDESIYGFDVFINSESEDSIESIVINWFQDADYFLTGVRILELPFFGTLNFYLSDKKLDESEDYWNTYLKAKKAVLDWE